MQPYIVMQRYGITKHNGCINAWKTYHIRLHAQYGFPADKHNMSETRRRKKELNQNINLK